MPTSDTSEKGLETLIVESFVNEAGYQQGRSEDYSPDHAGRCQGGRVRENEQGVIRIKAKESSCSTVLMARK